MAQNELEAQYLSITKLYGLAEELIGTVEHKTVDDPDQHLDMIQPLVEQVTESTTQLTEEFIVIAENGQRPARNSKSRIETALRRVYVAVDDYKKRVQTISKQAADKITKLTDPIVEKIKDTTEKVVTIFAKFVNDLSLNRIMHHTDIERFRKNQPKIALMLHGAAPGH